MRRQFPVLLALLLMVPAARAAAGDALRAFDIPLGAAEQSLRQFSEQAGLQVLFPTEVVRDIQTNPIMGNLEPRLALERMFAGTEVSVVADDGSGTLEVRRDSAPAGEPVVLPPMSVTSRGVPWRFAESPGFVFLSHLSDTVTRAYVEGMSRALRMLELLVPREFLLESDVRQIVIMVPDGRGSSAMSRRVLNNFADSPTAAPTLFANIVNPSALNQASRQNVRLVRDLELIDRDRAAIFTSVNEASFDGSRLFVRPEHFEYLLSARRPELPSWLVAGILKLYAHDRVAFQIDGVDLPGIEWLSPAETRLAANDAKFRAEALMPMDEFLRAPASALRDVQAALFVRWSLDSWVSARESNFAKASRAARGGAAAQPNRTAFWRFVARASAEPVSEAMFEECFGIGFREMRERLSAYLRDAVRTPVRLQLERGTEPAPPAVRNATPAEVAWIKGDWERLETSFVRARHPQYAQSYAFQARATLMHAYREGVRDPAVLAIIGLYECNLGNDEAARPFLEAAIEAGVVRPQVYYELARILYAEAKANPTGRNRMLSAAQATAVTAPLLAVQEQTPVLREVFDLAAVAWSNSDTALTRRELALLDTGLRFFPRDLDLLYKAALVNAVQGYKAETTALVERGLKYSRDTDNHARFFDILTKLDPEKGMQPVEGFRFVERRTPKAAFEAIVWATNIGAESTLNAALSLAGDAMHQANILRMELEAVARRAEFASVDKLAVLSYKTLFEGVTGVQVLDQSAPVDGVVHLDARLRRSDDTIDLETFAFKLGVGGWQLVVPEQQFDRLRAHLTRTIAPATARRAGPDRREPDVLVVGDLMAELPDALRPRPGRPVYYTIIARRENDLGSSIANERRPEPADVEREVVRALAEEGFMQTGPRGPRASLALVIEWGTANLDVDEYTVPAPPVIDFGGPRSPDEPEPSSAETITLTTVYNRREIMALVGADKANAARASEAEMALLNDAMSQRRSYVSIGAFDAAAIQKRQRKLLWRTRMSIGSLTQSLPDALGVMLASGAPHFGQNTVRPVFVTEKDRKAEVQVGTPTVVPEP